MKAVSKTAFYCCGVRMQDAESTHPVLGDYYAKRLMSEEGLQYWQEFKEFKMPNASNTARHYIIDNYLKELLSAHRGATVILIGAGLDSIGLSPEVECYEGCVKGWDQYFKGNLFKLLTTGKGQPT